MRIDWPSKADTERKLAEAAGNKSAVARSLGVSVSTFKDYLKREGIECESQLRVVEELPIDAPERLKADQDAATIKALKRENTEYAKALAKQEQFFDRIVEATRIPVKAAKYKPRKQNAKLPPRSVVCPIYDQQFGQLVRTSDTPGGKGNFNTVVFDRRLARWVDGVTSNLAKQSLGYRATELIFVLGGDNVEGDEIFSGQSWQLELDPPTQVWQLALKMTEALTEVIRFAKEELGIPRLAMYAVVGNHGKVGGKRSGARPVTYSWDWLFQKILFDRLRGEPIDEFALEPAGALFFYAAGIEFQAVHGENIKGWGGIPFYGIARYDSRSVRLHNRLFRYLLMGHIHQRAEITTGSGAEAIVSGDWVGANNLSGMITAASRPQQSLIYVAQKWGVTDTHRIYLTDAEAAHEPSPIYGLAAAA